MATTGTDCDDIECNTGLVNKPETISKDDRNEEEIQPESNFLIFYKFLFWINRVKFCIFFKEKCVTTEMPSLVENHNNVKCVTETGISSKNKLVEQTKVIKVLFEYFSIEF